MQSITTTTDSNVTIKSLVRWFTKFRGDFQWKDNSELKAHNRVGPISKCAPISVGIWCCQTNNTSLLASNAQSENLDK